MFVLAVAAAAAAEPAERLPWRLVNPKCRQVDGDEFVLLAREED